MNLADFTTRGMLVLYNDADPTGLLLRLGSGSGWTHVAMCLGDGTAVQCDARMGGVAIEPAFQQRNPKAIGVYPGDIERVIGFYLERYRAKDHYDYLGLLASVLYRFGITMPLRANAWNCATFLAAPMLTDALVKDRLPRKPASAWTPADFVKVVA